MKKYDYVTQCFLFNGKKYKVYGKTLQEAIEKKDDEILLRAYHSADETTRRNIRIILQIPDEPQGNSTALLSS